jgi:hypothetical protein
VVRRVVPALLWLERFICPRWATPFGATKCVVGGGVLLADVLCQPIPSRGAMICWRRSRCVGVVYAASLGTALEGGGTITTAAG